MYSNIGQRIATFIKRINISQQEFASILGTSRTAISSIVRGERPVSNGMQERILAAFPDLSRYWLLNGEGDMLNSDSDMQELEAISENEIPFYDAETTGGTIGRVSSSMEEVHMTGYLDMGSMFCDRPDAALRHVGESMAEYPDGCILMVKEIQNARLMVPGDNYVFETSESRITKRYAPGPDPDCIVLHSTNRECYPDGSLVYPPYTVLKSDIRRVFSIMGYVVAKSCKIRYI